MKAILLAVALLVSTVCFAQVPPRNFAADILTGVQSVSWEDGEMRGETLKNVGTGVIYRWVTYKLKDDGTGYWGYDFALGGHIFLGVNLDGLTEFKAVAGPSLLDGWIRIEGGWDFQYEAPVVMFSTSFGITFPGTL